MRTPMKRVYFALLGSLFAVTLSGCGGGGANVSAPTGGAAPSFGGNAATQAIARTAGTGNVAIAVAITPKPKPATKPGPLYISPSTESLKILTDGANPVIVNLTPSSPNCQPNPSVSGSYICTASLNVPAGNHVFTLSTYDQTGGTGKLLSTNTTGTVYVNPVGTTTIAISLQGVVKYAVLSLATTSPPTGSPATIGLTVLLEDADQNLIVGPAAFENPVTLTTTDATNGALSKTALKSPADEAGITVAYSGASVASITYSATATGLPAANVTNAVLTPGSASPNPNASNALGIYTSPNGPTYAFVPNSSGLSVVEIGNGSKLNSALRSADSIIRAAFTPIQVPLNPAPSACTPDSNDKLLYCFSFFNPTVNVLDLSTLPSAPAVKATYQTDAASGVPNSSRGCVICGAVYDSTDKAIVYATGNGYELYSSALAASPNIHLSTTAVNVSENFGYDSKTDTIFSPNYFGYPTGSQSIDIVPLGSPAVYHLSPQPAGLDNPDAGAVDPSTGVAVSTEEITGRNTPNGTNTAYLVNINAPSLNSPSSGRFTAPETTTGLTSSLFGFNTAVQCAVPVTNIAIDSVGHLAFFSAEFCGQSSADQYQFNGAVTPIGVAALPQSSTAPLQFGKSIFANLPPLPDGTLWDDALDPHAIAAFNITGCTHCGAIFNLEDTWIAVIDLVKLAAAPPSASDPHTVDSSYDLIANGVVTYFPTGFRSTTAAALARPHLAQFHTGRP